MREEYHRLLSYLDELGRPALISELRKGFQVNDRTLRRWLLELCDEGKVEATGANKGRRYQLAPPPEADLQAVDETLDGLQQDLLREAIRDAVCGHTLTILFAERTRSLLPAPARPGFISSTLQHLQAMTGEKATSLGVSPEAFARWRRLQSEQQDAG